MCLPPPLNRPTTRPTSRAKAAKRRESQGPQASSLPANREASAVAMPPWEVIAGEGGLCSQAAAAVVEVGSTTVLCILVVYAISSCNMQR